MADRYDHRNKKICNIFKTVIIFLVFRNVSKSGVFCKRSDSPSTAKKSDKQWQVYIDVSTTPDNYYENYEIQLETFRIHSEHCSAKYKCSKNIQNVYKTFPDKLCHCDKLCGLMNDCCGNYGNTLMLSLTKDQFECMILEEIVKNRDYGVTMVTKCSTRWKHNVTKTLCEGVSKNDDILHRLPVSDRTNFNIMFKNMYCAQCNFINDFLYWKQEIHFRNETGMRSLPEMNNYILNFIRPQPEISYRICQSSQSIISTCTHPEETSASDLIRNCTDGVYGITYDESGMVYRNKYCALCNGVVDKSMLCEQFVMTPTGSTTNDTSRVYSLRMVVDINIGIVYHSEKPEIIQLCKDNELYDSLSQRCREIVCAPPRTAMNGVCSRFVVSERENHPDLLPENCTFTQLNFSEFKFINNSYLLIFSHRKVYSKEQFHVNGSDVFICLNKTHQCLHDCSATNPRFYSDIVEGYMTLVGLTVSILALAITLAVYVAFPQLLNTPGKILVSLIISLLSAQVLFIAAFKAEQLPTLCTILGVLVHYFFLAAFCWMNVIAFDLWMTFSNRFLASGPENKGRKRFAIYSFYAWLLPVAIVCTAVILDFINIDETFQSFKPEYGKRVCWLSSRYSLLLFFAGPLALCKLFDIVSFISTAIHISRAKKQGAIATRNKSTCSFLINIKLSLIMGLTWVFAFVANVTNETIVWYLFIIFNSLQGLFIAICFLCTKKVCHLMRDKYKKITIKYASGTQNSSVV
ncbi:uncharacterized protein LOC123552405 [Mercenaria mercenaria]|uniref:uncharacterized protein LOC123552405 n=1 Tax=Mercenaria mercenaria TaxID=6596 RepID=UPI00234EABD8|nr:uncharacterized protein LOC123552405 [Mercenaria mercenaria]